MIRFLTIALCAMIGLVSIPVFAQEQKCEGPAELCAQIMDLRSQLAAQKNLTARKEEEKTEVVQVKDNEKVQAVQTEARNMAATSTRMIAFAALFAVVLKLAISVLKSWKTYFTSDKGKAWLKITTLAMGLGALLLTNVGLGLPFWQSLIIAGGGPGAMVIHDIVDLIPVLLGKKPMPKSASDFPPPDDQAAPPTA